MPHLVTNRPRHYSAPSFCQIQGFEIFNLIAYFCGGLIFIVGSIFFLPTYKEYLEQGAILFAVGSILYLTVSLHDLFEGFVSFGSDWASMKHDTWKYVEMMANSFYTIGGVFFVVGSILFLPEVGETIAGSYCFIFGSALYGFGSVINMFMIYTEASPLMVQLLNFIAVNFLCGSLLFIVGSIMYVFKFTGLNAGDSYIIYTYAGWEFIVGSMFFSFGGIVNAVRIILAARFHRDYENSHSMRKFFHRLTDANWKELFFGTKEEREHFREHFKRYKSEQQAHLHKTQSYGWYNNDHQKPFNPPKLVEEQEEEQQQQQPELEQPTNTDTTTEQQSISTETSAINTKDEQQNSIELQEIKTTNGPPAITEQKKENKINTEQNSNGKEA